MNIASPSTVRRKDPPWRRGTRVLAPMLLLAGTAAAVARPQAAEVVVVPVQGVIEMGLAPFVERSLREAARDGAALVVLDLDTPGGRVDAAQRVTDAVQESEVPVVAMVNRRALSAGAMIALSTGRIFLLPGASMGAATPVLGTSGETAPEKIVSAMRAEMRALAEAHGMDPRVAEAMVDPAVDLQPHAPAGRLLTLTTQEAEELRYGTATESLETLLAGVGVSGAEVTRTQVNWAERVVRLLSHPLVAPFLLSLGFLGLVIEVKTPGFGLAGGAGFLALSLYFGSHLIVGLAGWEDLLLFGVGLLLILLEVLVVPGFGVLGVLGLLGVLSGLFFSLLGSLPTFSDLANASGVLAVTMIAVLVTGWALVRRLPRSGRLARRGLLLDAETDREAGYVSAEARADLVGREGVAITTLRPAGVALVDGERIDVVTESEWIPEGTPVRILSAEGYRHVVRAVSTIASGGDQSDTGSAS